MRAFELVRATRVKPRPRRGRIDWLRWIRRFVWLACLSAFAQTAAAQSADQIALSYTAAPDPVVPGAKLVYTIRVANISATTATGAFVIRANFAEHVTASYVVDGSNCYNGCRYGGYTQYNVPSLAPGASTVLRYTADVDNSAANPPPPAGTVLSSDLVVLGAGNATIKTATASAVVASAEPTAQLAVSLDTNRAAPGATLSYRLFVGNAGGAAQTLRLRAALPAGTSFVSASGGGALSGGNVEWNLANLPAGFNDWRELIVRVADNTPNGALLPLRAELLDGASASLNRVTSTGLVASSSPVVLTFQALPSVALGGDTVVYKVHITNRSPNTPTAPFTVRAQLPAHAQVTFNVDGSNCYNGCRYSGHLQWNVASLAPGESSVFEFVAELDNSAANPPPARGTLLFSEITAAVNGGVEASDALAVADGDNLRLISSLERERPQPGQELTYRLTFGNAGNGAKPTKLRARLPSDTSFVSASGGGTVSDGWVEWDLGTLAAGAIDRRELTLRVADAATPGSLLSLRAELIEPGTLRSIRRSAVAAQVSTEPQLSLVLSAAPSVGRGGAVIVYRARIANRSPNTPTGPFVVRAHFPGRSTVKYVVDGSNCYNGCRFGGFSQWNLPSLEPGTSTELLYTLELDNSAQQPPPALGELLHAEMRANVWGGYRSSEVVAVSDGAAFDLSTSTAQDRAAPGSDVALKLSFGNTGSQARPARLQVRVPDGASFVSAEGATHTNSLVYWDLDMTAGHYDDRVLTIKPNAGLTSGTLLNVQPELVSLEDGHRYVASRYPVLVAAESRVSLVIEPARTSVVGGDTLIYKLTLTNLSTSVETGAFTVRAWFSDHATTSAITDGSNCYNGCRLGGFGQWSVASLSPGASRMLQYTTKIDNSSQDPPPAAGSVLEAHVRAMVAGEVLGNSVVFVGTRSIPAYVPGTGPDAGAGGDSGTSDAGGTDASVADASGGDDASSGADAGVEDAAVDAGAASADGGSSSADGGSGSSRDDAGGRDDGGDDDQDDEDEEGSNPSSTRESSGGCSCHVAGAEHDLSGGWFSLLGASALLVRRRRIRALGR